MKQLFALKIETYAVPSLWRPIAFVSRAKLPRDFDQVFAKARYPVQYIEIARNPLAALLAVVRRARLHMLDPIRAQEQSVQADFGDLEPLLRADMLKRVLCGIDPMTPTLSNQQLWALMLSPGLTPIDKAQDEDVWNFLLAYNMPLIDELSTKAQQDGIRILNLLNSHPPDLLDLQKRLAEASGWSISLATNEIKPLKYFSLLAKKHFPTVTTLRPMYSIFAGFEPDLWHEAVGHLAILTDPDFAEFYQWCGALVLDLKNQANAKLRMPELYKVLWVILEYGILKTPSGQLQAFGGALTSSYMALQRLKRGYIVTVPFDPKAILDSGLADGFPVKRRKNKIELFHVDSLISAKNIIEKWIC